MNSESHVTMKASSCHVTWAMRSCDQQTMSQDYATTALPVEIVKYIGK